MLRSTALAGLILSTTAVGSDAITDARTQQPASALVRRIAVQPDQAPDCSSLGTIARSVTRHCTTDDQRAIAIYNFMLLSFYHCDYAREDGGIPALKVITSYGWGLCGGTHAVQSALWRELGWGWRFVGWPGHTTVEAQYGGRWHYLDAFLKYYAWMPDGGGGRTIAGEKDLRRDKKSLIDEALVYDDKRRCWYDRGDECAVVAGQANWRARSLLDCGDSMETGVPKLNFAGAAESWMGYNHATGDYSTDVDLAPGVALTCGWDALPDAWWWKDSGRPPSHSCPNHKDVRNNACAGLILEPYADAPTRTWANGTLAWAPDFADPAALGALTDWRNIARDGHGLVPADPAKPASITVRLASPYVLTRGSATVDGADEIAVSTDGGANFTAVQAQDFSANVRGRLAVLLRATFSRPLRGLRVDLTTQENPGPLPYLSPGRNQVAVSVADPHALGDDRLVVTYAYRLGSRASSYEQLCDRGQRIADRVDAAWDDRITYVRRAFTAKDLPATLTIDCPTPSGRFPVYPRMVFVRREIVGPRSQPSQLPADAVEAAPVASDRLVALPDPFLVGAVPTSTGAAGGAP